jgi:DNA-binding transcriptional regulator YiaG
MISPDSEQIKQARGQAGLTQAQAAELIYKGLRTWQQWERGDRDMDPALFELFRLKTGQISLAQMPNAPG